MTPIRDAATLILTRNTREGLTVVMGKRNAGAVFMPDKYVCPGGALDEADRQAPCPLEIGAESMRRLSFESDIPAQALANTALRECHEETGLDPTAFALPEGARLTLEFCYRAITPPGRTRRFDARFFRLHLPSSLAAGAFVGDGELSELDWYPVSSLHDLPLADITRNVCSSVFSGTPSDAVPFARRGSGAAPDWIE